MQKTEASLHSHDENACNRSGYYWTGYIAKAIIQKITQQYSVQKHLTGYCKHLPVMLIYIINCILINKNEVCKNMWRFLWKFIITCLTTLCTLITITQFFFGTSTYADLANRFNLPTSIPLNPIVSIPILLIIFVYQLIAYYRDARHAKLAGENMHSFHHDIRNEIFRMRLQSSIDPPANFDDFYSSISSICKMLCDRICSFFKEKTGKKFSVCIKLLKHDSSSGDPTQEMKAYTYTLCRSGDDADVRINAALLRANSAAAERDIFVPIKENTAFYSLMSNEYTGNTPKPTIFACSNLFMFMLLNKILKRTPYQNPNKDFMKYYLSTIVVPIKINSAFLPNSTQSTAKYTTIGFLCIDHKRPISKALINELAEYSKSYADAFFNLLFEMRRRDWIIRDKSTSNQQNTVGAEI